jgi:uncharacterized membrane protein YphA (DoxX/SURF4 family)
LICEAYTSMSIFQIIDGLHANARNNRWIGYFTIFCRLALAAGFIPSGLVKVMGERFTSLSVNHPMGHYLEALFHTGYYYPFIGVMQITAAILLLIPRTATIGALLYFPVILNICILSLAVRFEGSMLSSPLMVTANVYLLCWDYDKLKSIVIVHRPTIVCLAPGQVQQSITFAVRFFASAAAMTFILVLLIVNAFTIVPRNSLKDCQQQFVRTNRTKAGDEFCHCIHEYGYSLDRSLQEYYQAPDDVVEPYLEPLLPSAFFVEY